MITDFLKDSDTYEKEHLKKSTARPSPKMDVHTIFGDMRRWYEGNVFNHSDYKIDKAKYEMLKAYYDEKSKAVFQRKIQKRLCCFCERYIILVNFSA